MKKVMACECDKKRHLSKYVMIKNLRMRKLQHKIFILKQQSLVFLYLEKVMKLRRI